MGPLRVARLPQHGWAPCVIVGDAKSAGKGCALQHPISNARKYCAEARGTHTQSGHKRVSMPEGLKMGGGTWKQCKRGGHKK
eukprot:365099-Chlamydomonas_euryale.AAC.5